MSFHAEYLPKKDEDWFNLVGFEPNTSSIGTCRVTAAMTASYTKDIAGIRFYMFNSAGTSSGNFLANSKIAMYKYSES